MTALERVDARQTALRWIEEERSYRAKGGTPRMVALDAGELDAIIAALTPVGVTDEHVEQAARAIVRGRGALANASDEVWPSQVAAHRRMLRHYPGYVGAPSLIADAFRDARNALEAIQPAVPADIAADGNRPHQAPAPASEAAP